MKVKEESEKIGLKLNIQKTKILASGPITSWQIGGKQWKQWETLHFGLQNHCRWWLQPWNKKMPTPWEKSYAPTRKYIKNKRHYLANKVHLVKAMVFPVVMYGCESWTIKKVECCRIDAFELWCWRGLLRVPWTAGRSNQSILKELSPECSLEELMLKLKLQYFGHLMRRIDSFEKTLILGKMKDKRKRGWQRMRWSLTQWKQVWISSRCWWWTGKSGVLQSMGLQRVRNDWATGPNFTSLNSLLGYMFQFSMCSIILSAKSDSFLLLFQFSFFLLLWLPWQRLPKLCWKK